jgi:hypothetical protein
MTTLTRKINQNVRQGFFPKDGYYLMSRIGPFDSGIHKKTFEAPHWIPVKVDTESGDHLSGYTHIYHPDWGDLSDKGLDYSECLFVGPFEQSDFVLWTKDLPTVLRNVAFYGNEILDMLAKAGEEKELHASALRLTDCFKEALEKLKPFIPIT